MKKKPYSIFSNAIFLLREIAKTYPLLFIFIFIEMTLSVISPLLGIYLPSLAVSLITEQANRTAVLLKLGGFGLLLAITGGLRSMSGEGKYYMYNEMRTRFRFQLFFRSISCDYSNIESKAGLTKYQRAMDSLGGGDWAGTSRMLTAMIAIVTNTLCFLIYSGILTTLHPLIVIMLIGLSLFNMALTRTAQNYEHRFQDQRAGLEQKMDYIEYTARDIHYGKDIRLYNMSEWFLAMRDTLTEASRGLKNRLERRYFIINCINLFTHLLRNIITYGYLIYTTASGIISVTDFVLYFGAITGFSSFFESITGNYTQLHEANFQMNDLRAYLDLADEPEPEDPAALPDTDQISIDFDHVWFSYDLDSEPVLKDFCLHIHSGEKLALVGINGAGKTTIIKLLCGMYRPDSGSILINGIDIRRFRKADLYSLFSAVFQDIYIAPHTVAENVSLKTAAETDMKQVENCLEQTGLLTTIQSYPDALHTQMTKSVCDGIILSGGQQQKLLMARALYKDAPVMILDEPTAALDPIAENETYENFHRLTGDKTVIYISHRLASTRFCDRIIFLENGKVSESGTHDQLMQRNGGYANMFEVQSHYYKKEENTCAQN